MSRARNTVAAKAQALLRCRVSARILLWPKRSNVDHPLADPRRMERVIRELPLIGDPRQALEGVNHWLLSIHQTPAFAAAQRYVLVSALDTATRASQARLLEPYVAQRRERVIEEKQVWQIITRFWTLLAQGYLDCAQACGDSDSLPRGIEEQSPRLAARGLRALRCQLKRLLLRYADIPADVWPACGRLLTLAERGAAAATPLSLYDDSETPSSPHAELLRLAMVHSVSPASLSPAEQHIAERVVVYLTRKFRIDGEHHNRCDYCFDLRGKRPPLRRLANSPTTATTRYLEVSDARHWTSAAYALVCGTGRLPSDLDLGTAVETPTVARVLQQLNVQWSKGAPPRATGRQKIDADLHAVHGYNNVVRVVTASDRGRPDDTRRQAAILLDERPLPDGSLYIVARRGLLDTREAIEARFGADSTSVILEPAGLVESGADFDWLRYRVTSVAF